jgi:hypothetical protein
MLEEQPAQMTRTEANVLGELLDAAGIERTIRRSV